MADNLKERAAKGILWKFLDHGGAQIIQFISGIYIARILSPEDYGLVGMLAIFLGISQMFIDSGFKATLIQKGKEITQIDYNVVFFFNVLVSVVFYIFIYWGAPSISEFYNEPRLINVARILGLNLILMSLGMIHQVIFEKRLNFKTVAKIRILSTLISVVIGVIASIKGIGVWALVLMMISESFIKTLFLWLINKWKPTLNVDISSFKSLFSIGSKLMFAGLLQQISNNIFSLIIGKVFTTADVGFYSQGRKLQQRIGDAITFSIQGVLFPVQSLLKDDLPRLKNAVRKNVKISAFISFPTVIGLVAVAKPFVVVALTEKWLPSVDFIYLLSIAGLFYMIWAGIQSYALPLKKINYIVRFTAFSNLLLVLIIVVGTLLKFDLKMLVAGKILQEFIVLIITVYFSKKFIDYRMNEVIKDIISSALISIIMGAIIYIIGNQLGISLLSLLLQVIFGLGLYLILSYFFNRTILIELISFLKKMLKI